MILGGLAWCMRTPTGSCDPRACQCMQEVYTLHALFSPEVKKGLLNIQPASHPPGAVTASHLPEPTSSLDIVSVCSSSTPKPRHCSPTLQSWLCSLHCTSLSILSNLSGLGCPGNMCSGNHPLHQYIPYIRAFKPAQYKPEDPEPAEFQSQQNPSLCALLRIIGGELPFLQDIYRKWCLRKAGRLIKDSSHPSQFQVCVSWVYFLSVCTV